MPCSKLRSGGDSTARLSGTRPRSYSWRLAGDNIHNFIRSANSILFGWSKCGLKPSVAAFNVVEIFGAAKYLKHPRIVALFIIVLGGICFVNDLPGNKLWKSYDKVPTIFAGFDFSATFDYTISQSSVFHWIARKHFGEKQAKVVLVHDFAKQPHSGTIEFSTQRHLQLIDGVRAKTCFIAPSRWAGR